MYMKTRCMVWLLLAIGCMFIIYHTSGTSYSQQDIKPAMEKYISRTAAQLPSIHFSYDHENVSTEQPSVFTHFILRKAGHVTEYAILTFFMMMSIRFSNYPFVLRICASCTAAFLFAWVDEWHRLIVPDRLGSFLDVYTFDLVGIVLCAVFYSMLHVVVQKRDTSLPVQNEEEPEGI